MAFVRTQENVPFFEEKSGVQRFRPVRAILRECGQGPLPGLKLTEHKNS